MSLAFYPRRPCQSQVACVFSCHRLEVSSVSYIDNSGASWVNSYERCEVRVQTHFLARGRPAVQHRLWKRPSSLHCPCGSSGGWRGSTGCLSRLFHHCVDSSPNTTLSWWQSVSKLGSFILQFCSPWISCWLFWVFGLSTQILETLCQYPQNNLLGFWLGLGWIYGSSWEDATSWQHGVFLSMNMDSLSPFIWIIFDAFHQVWQFSLCSYHTYFVRFKYFFCVCVQM